MTLQEARRRVIYLRKTINEYRHAYHVRNESRISDEALDSLKKELFDLEQAFPDLVTPDSPTQRIAGKPLDEFVKVKHETPMISLNDAFSEDDMRAWVERLENYLGEDVVSKNTEPFYCELKIDGLAIELVYEDGVFVQGSTRGDGMIGEDVTQNLKTIEAIPLRIPIALKGYSIPKRLVIRGEVFLTKEEFERINNEQKKKGEKEFANPRNVAAGSVRQLDPLITASRKLDSFAYDIVTDIGQKTHKETHDILHRLGFKTNTHNRALQSLDDVFTFRNYWEHHREKLSYEIDGVVVIVNDNTLFMRAGVVGKAPRAAIAYKFSPQEATTIVEDIKIQIGRTGVLTPVAILRPVNVGGVTITHATLHNFGQIERLDLRIGDTVIVNRAGDVIPYLSGVVKSMRTGRGRKFHIPKKCPIDGSVIQVDGAIYRCSNPDCGSRSERMIRHFVSRGAFNIEGIGPKIIDRFFNEGLITDAADIFGLQKGDIAVLERFGEKSAQNLIEEIALKKNITLARFLYSIGILHVGEETARVLAHEVQRKNVRIKTPCDVWDFFSGYTAADFEAIHEIGPIVAKSIYEWFHSKQNKVFLEKLDRAGVRIIVDIVSSSSQQWAGKTFVLTGTLRTMSREEAKEKIRARGGAVSESVSQKTTYVVAGENTGSKLDKARARGIPILSEADFQKLL